MGRYILNSLTLKEVGIRLLPEEKLEVAVELEGGLTDELENSHATLLLTDKRLIRYSASGHKTSVVSAALEDVDSIEVNKKEKNKQWVWVGFVFIIGGLLLGLLPLIVASSPVSPLLMAFALALIGVVFILTYIGGDGGEVIVRAGVKDIKSRMRPKALDDMAIFVQRVYELKMGYAGLDLISLDEEEASDEPEAAEPDSAPSEVASVSSDTEL